MKHTIVIDRWRPTPLNKLLGHWGKAHRLKATDRAIVYLACRDAGVAKATGKRRVSLTITLSGRMKPCDPDGVWKSLLDALVQAGALKDDSKEWVELGTVWWARGPLKTVIELEDVE